MSEFVTRSEFKEAIDKLMEQITPVYSNYIQTQANIAWIKKRALHYLAAGVSAISMGLLGLAIQSIRFHEATNHTAIENHSDFALWAKQQADKDKAILDDLKELKNKTR